MNSLIDNNLLMIILSGIIIILIFFIPVYLRTKKLHKILDVDNDPETFLSEIDKDIDKTKNKKYMNYLMIRKSTGLAALGKYREAVNLLKLIELIQLPKLHIVEYYNSLLFNLFLSGDLEEAENVYEATKKLLNDYISQKSFTKAIKTNFALYEFHRGDLKKSQQMFEELLMYYELLPREKPVINYYMGSIYLKQEEREKASEKLNIVLESSNNNPLLRKKANSLLKQI